MAPSLTKMSSLLFILLLHLACFVLFTGKSRRHQDQDQDQPKADAKKPKNRVLSFLQGIFTAAKHYSCKPSAAQTHPSTSTPPRSSQHSANHDLLSDSTAVAAVNSRRRPSLTESEINVSDTADLFFPLRNDIFPCTLCGEVFQKPQPLETHKAVKHAVNELLEGDSGNNIMRIIFKTGWDGKKKQKNEPTIHRILKIHNGSKILSRFEEYREAVKAKAALYGGGGRRRDERCIADGNELLRFHCSTFVCDLGRDGGSGVCSHQYCGVCGIIRSGFSAKLDGISTMSTSWRAHAAVPEDLEEEFAFMNVKRAMLVCRVIAGRVGSDADDDKGGESCDSVLGRAGCGTVGRAEEEELLVFNPRAVLPCFVIVYTTVREGVCVLYL